MQNRLLAALFVLAALPFLATGQEKKDIPAGDNPYKNAEPGDAAVYKVTTKLGPLSLDGTLTQVVVSNDGKEVTLNVEGTVNNMAIPAQLMKIDLTKPYDPTKGAPVPGLEAKVEKDKSGTEKLKFNNKDTDCTWDTYKMKAKAQGVDFEANMKVWQTKDVKLGMLKMELTADVGGNKIDMTMELTEIKKVELPKKE